MSSTSQQRNVGSKLHTWVKQHADLILELPEPGQEYRFHDVASHPEEFETVREDLPQEFVRTRPQLQQYGAIRHAMWHYDSHESSGYYLWETDPAVYEHAKQYREDRDQFPCGHVSGFRTLDPEDGICECGYRFCGETFDRETVQSIDL